MAVLTIVQGTKRVTLEAEPGATLLESLCRAGYPHTEAPCGGRGRCGRCLVEATGALTPPTARELALLPPGDSRRLACMAVPEGDCTVTLPAGELAAATEGMGPEFSPDGDGTGLGAAADIGTTTVVLYLYDLKTGQRLATASGGNAQRAFGSDVISLIQYTMEHPDGLEMLKKAIRAQLNGLLARACRDAEKMPAQVEKLVVAGNTVMLHLLAGLDPASIASAPFVPLSLFGRDVPAEELGLTAAPGASVWLTPCVSGYIGGDITAGLMASGIGKAEKPVLFVDIGTNGEMALGTRDGLLCCSTAAGPAFEGGDLSCGMAAAPGAIHKVWLDGGEIRCSVLGDTEAVGLCGSGILDALAVMLEAEIVDETGRLAARDELPESFASRMTGDGSTARFFLTEKVWVTAEDVRKLQLAKAAVAAGIQTLMAHRGMRCGDISSFCLAGGFGSYLRPESAARLGLFPAELLPRLKVMGNSAGLGAAAALVSARARADTEMLAARCDYLELSGRKDFAQNYVECMMFE